MKLTKEQWDAAPETAEWFAVDECGMGWFYKYKPMLSIIGWNGNTLGSTIYIGADCDWRNSLQQRPKDETETLKARIAELEAELEQYKPKPKVTDGLVEFDGINFLSTNPSIEHRVEGEYAYYGIYLDCYYSWEIVTDSQNESVLICRKKS